MGKDVVGVWVGNDVVGFDVGLNVGKDVIGFDVGLDVGFDVGLDSSGLDVGLDSNGLDVGLKEGITLGSDVGSIVGSYSKI